MSEVLNGIFNYSCNNFIYSTKSTKKTLKKKHLIIVIATMICASKPNALET